MGTSYFIGKSKGDEIKLDLYYTDTFIRPLLSIENTRMATKEEIAAMKIDIVQRGARKKDFWDIHELLDEITPSQMIALHAERYPFAHDEAAIKSNFTNFSRADEDFNPNCLRGKHWEIIKLEIAESMEMFNI